VHARIMNSGHPGMARQVPGDGQRAVRLAAEFARALRHRASRLD
jgi:hypothetical protein